MPRSAKDWRDPIRMPCIVWDGENLARLRGGHHPGAEMHRQAPDAAVVAERRVFLRNFSAWCVHARAD
jgi:hypothetical protein